MEESDDQGSSDHDEWGQDSKSGRETLVRGTNNTEGQDLVPEIIGVVIEVLAVAVVRVLAAIYRAVSVAIANLDIQAGLLHSIVVILAHTSLNAVHVVLNEVGSASLTALKQTNQERASV